MSQSFLRVGPRLLETNLVIFQPASSEDGLARPLALGPASAIGLLCWARYWPLWAWGACLGDDQPDLPPGPLEDDRVVRHGEDLRCT